MKTFMRIRRFFLFMWLHILARVWYFLLAFLKSAFTWKSKLNLSSRFNPRNLTFSLFKISVLKICISKGVSELAKRWHFPAFAPKWFVENQWNIFSNAPCILCSTFSIFESVCKDYWYLHIQQSQYLLALQKTCHRYILNKRGPKTEPWG